MTTKMKRVRIRGIVDVVLDVPMIITFEEISADFRKHAKNGNYHIKNIKFIGEEEIV